MFAATQQRDPMPRPPEEMQSLSTLARRISDVRASNVQIEFLTEPDVTLCITCGKVHRWVFEIVPRTIQVNGETSMCYISTERWISDDDTVQAREAAYHDAEQLLNRITKMITLLT
jgi:hypothetical protein